MLTKTGVNKILRRIYETGGMTPDMEEDIKRLQDELDEREGVLRRYGEVYDGEDKDDYEYVGRDLPKADNDWEVKYRDAESRYSAMRQRYLDRFFGTTDVKTEAEDIVDNMEEDVKEDGEAVTFDELLERKEED